MKQFEERNGVKSHLEVVGTAFNTSPMAELQALRIIQEALVNVRKHAHATEVWVTLKNTLGGTEVTIKDNGRGFTPAAPTPENGSGHHGLTSMRERAEGLGGTFTIVSTPGEGTEVQIVMPGGRVRGVPWSG